MKRVCGLMLLAAIAFVAASGCSGSSKVECKVTLNGTPIEGATVLFHPESPEYKGPNPSGVTDSSGTALISTGDKPGAPKGKYKVTIVKNEGVSGLTVDPTKDPTEAMKEAGNIPGKGAKGPPRGGVGFKPKLLTPDLYNDPNTSTFTIDVGNHTNPTTFAMVGDAPKAPPPKK